MAKAGKTRNFFVWIIMGLLFIGLMGFGATGLTGTVRSIGSAGEKPISAQNYYLEVQNRIRSAAAQQGRAISFPEAEADGIPALALQAVVGRRALDNEAATLGLSVGDEVISEQVLATPSFRGIDGSFDRTQYREALAQSGLSVREYEDSLRDQASRALIQGAVFTGIPDPQVYADTLAQFSREGRTFTWASLTEADVEIVLPEPSEDDLQAHYDANPDLYRTLETREIRYVWLTPDMIQDETPVDEDELRAEYDARLEEFQQPERRLVEQLVFSDAEAAEAALAQIEAEETTFPDLVAARGLTLNDVDIGDVTEAQMDEAGPAIFAAQTGDTVGPFPTDLGPALFRMNAILAARNTTFEQALPDLREDQAAARARRMIEDQIDPITNLLAGGALLADVADQTEMELGTIDWTTDVTDGIAAYAAFRDVAASTDVGDFAEVEELDDGGLFALEVVSIRAPEVPALDDIRADVIAGWEAEATAEAIAEEAEARAARLREGVEFSAADLDSIQETNLTRRAFVNGTPPTFMTDVFDMAVGDIRVLPNDGGAIVVRLDAITAADETDAAFAAEATALSESAAQGIAQDIYELYTRNIQVNTDVQLNQAAINAIHSNFR
ncbi:peptidylprolyl isomerase [Pseudooctadecabacter jejudonensis]|uniref:Peptidyl-prolyl cis-trans isomerase D n=1 Tax=Pseudooctadecabacter jejudonensis TaxID=1391910 RepID=A0A1Y5RBK0_9RHOB|nr:peptidyl-prolyl cis-trans isomerase [Pseudooctadecabacter jejudonensis]SLN12841.1 Peptidyl-prolyl cis-trans isomerase D [Pseudooctadecabacter jejudonensis]